jgi:hypothetical protein
MDESTAGMPLTLSELTDYGKTKHLISDRILGTLLYNVLLCIYEKNYTHINV